MREIPTRRDALADADLIERSRDGDREAFAELWRRHSSAATTAAKHFTSVAEADDLVAESYARIYAAIKRGGGPTGAFRPYLYTTLRNLARNWSRKEAPVLVEDFDIYVDPASHENPAEKNLERSLTLSAFRSLPERWQTVLWYSEVEQMDPHELAPLMGTTANGAAALAYRAREGLRKAWLQAHIADESVSPDCRWTLAHLPGFVRNSLSDAETARIEDHLIGCTRCTLIAAEVQDVGSRLALVVAPLILGAVGGGVLLASLREGSAAVAASLPPVPDPAAVGSSASAASGATGGSVTGWLVAGGVAAAAATLVTVGVFGGAFSPATEPATNDTPPVAAPEHTPEPLVQPTAPPTTDPTPPAEPPTTADPPPKAPPIVRPPVVTPPVVTPPVDPPVVAPDTESLPPTVSTTIDDLSTARPGLAGVAEPGATVTVTDDLGNEVATVVAAADGAWSIPSLDALSPGATRLDVTQVDVAGNASAPTEIGPLAFRPTVVSPTAISCPVNGTTDIVVGGWIGEDVSAFLDGDFGSPTTHTIGPDGTVTFTLTCGSFPGTVTLDFRYAKGTALAHLEGEITP